MSQRKFNGKVYQGHSWETIRIHFLRASKSKVQTNARTVVCVCAWETLSCLHWVEARCSAHGSWTLQIRKSAKCSVQTSFGSLPKSLCANQSCQICSIYSIGRCELSHLSQILYKFWNFGTGCVLIVLWQELEGFRKFGHGPRLVWTGQAADRRSLCYELENHIETRNLQLRHQTYVICDRWKNLSNWCCWQIGSSQNHMSKTNSVRIKYGTDTAKHPDYLITWFDWPHDKRFKLASGWGQVIQTSQTAKIIVFSCYCFGLPLRPQNRAS